MDRCTYSEMDKISCSHCISQPKLKPVLSEEGIGGFEIVDPVHDEPWERHDYVTIANDIPRQEVPNGEQFTTDVDVSDIYGTQPEAIRLQLRRR